MTDRIDSWLGDPDVPLPKGASQSPEGLFQKATAIRSAVFEATPSPYLVLTIDLTICDVNQAYLKVSGRDRMELIGQYIFDVFPDNPDDPDADGVRNLTASFERVLATGKPDSMALQRYDVQMEGAGTEFERRWWSPTNTPVLGEDGAVILIIHRPEEVTEFVQTRERAERLRPRTSASKALDEAVEADLFARGQELQKLNEQLRQATRRDHEDLVALQMAMLTVPPKDGDFDIVVRYSPASEAAKVGGDWYDAFARSDGVTALVVGDVIGHDGIAAVAMGELRGLLRCLAYAVPLPPAAALIRLEATARGLGVGNLATLVLAQLQPSAGASLTDGHLFRWSNAGHMPPILLYPDGRTFLLNTPPEPLFGVKCSTPRTDHEITLPSRATVLLYTDGLIERRGSSLDEGFSRLQEALDDLGEAPLEQLCDTLLDRLLPVHSDDDVALLAVRAHSGSGVPD